jgi:hypothetical protein
MMRGRRRPLLRGALVAGTGYAAGRHAARRQQAESEQDAAIADLQDQGQAQAPPAPPPAAAPAAAPAPSLVDDLARLGSLHSQGLISDEEFAAAKAKLLGG